MLEPRCRNGVATMNITKMQLTIFFGLKTLVTVSRHIPSSSCARKYVICVIYYLYLRQPGVVDALLDKLLSLLLDLVVGHLLTCHLHIVPQGRKKSSTNLLYDSRTNRMCNSLWRGAAKKGCSIFFRIFKKSFLKFSSFFKDSQKCIK